MECYSKSNITKGGNYIVEFPKIRPNSSKDSFDNTSTYLKPIFYYNKIIKFINSKLCYKCLPYIKKNVLLDKTRLCNACSKIIENYRYIIYFFSSLYSVDYPFEPKALMLYCLSRIFVPRQYVQPRFVVFRKHLPKRILKYIICFEKQLRNKLFYLCHLSIVSNANRQCYLKKMFLYEKLKFLPFQRAISKLKNEDFPTLFHGTFSYLFDLVKNKYDFKNCLPFLQNNIQSVSHNEFDKFKESRIIEYSDIPLLMYSCFFFKVLYKNRDKKLSLYNILYKFLNICDEKNVIETLSQMYHIYYFRGQQNKITQLLTNKKVKQIQSSKDDLDINSFQSQNVGKQIIIDYLRKIITKFPNVSEKFGNCNSNNDKKVFYLNKHCEAQTKESTNFITGVNSRDYFKEMSLDSSLACGLANMSHAYPNLKKKWIQSCKEEMDITTANFNTRSAINETDVADFTMFQQDHEGGSDASDRVNIRKMITTTTKTDDSTKIKGRKKNIFDIGNIELKKMNFFINRDVIMDTSSDYTSFLDAKVEPFIENHDIVDNSVDPCFIKKNDNEDNNDSLQDSSKSYQKILSEDGFLSKINEKKNHKGIFTSNILREYLENHSKLTDNSDSGIPPINPWKSLKYFMPLISPCKSTNDSHEDCSKISKIQLEMVMNMGIGKSFPEEVANNVEKLRENIENKEQFALLKPAIKEKELINRSDCNINYWKEHFQKNKRKINKGWLSKLNFKPENELFALQRRSKQKISEKILKRDIVKVDRLFDEGIKQHPFSLGDVFIWCCIHSRFSCNCTGKIIFLKNNKLIWKPSVQQSYLSIKNMSEISINDKFPNFHAFFPNIHTSRTIGSLFNYKLRNQSPIFRYKRFAEISNSVSSSTNSFIKVNARSMIYSYKEAMNKHKPSCTNKMLKNKEIIISEIPLNLCKKDNSKERKLSFKENRNLTSHRMLQKGRQLETKGTQAIKRSYGGRSACFQGTEIISANSGFGKIDENLLAEYLICNPTETNTSYSVNKNSQPLFKYGLLCLTAGFGYLLVKQFTADKLLVQDPLRCNIFRCLKDLDTANEWLNRLFKQHLIFESAEINLKWVVVKSTFLKYSHPFDKSLFEQSSKYVSKDGVLVNKNITCFKQEMEESMISKDYQLNRLTSAKKDCGEIIEDRFNFEVVPSKKVKISCSSREEGYNALNEFNNDAATYQQNRY